MKKGVLKNFAKFTKKYLCWRFFFENFIEKETLTQESFCLSVNLRNSSEQLFYRAPPATIYLLHLLLVFVLLCFQIITATEIFLLFSDTLQNLKSV